MEVIAGSAVAGLIAALTATIILGTAKWIYLEHLQRLDVKQIREVLTDGRSRVMESKDTFNRNINATVPGDMLRAARYNLMLKQLRVALDHATSKLSYAKRKDIFDALDWYHVKSLYLTKDALGNPVFKDDLPIGSWPTNEMQESPAIDKFKRLESIKWLKIEPYMPENGSGGVGWWRTAREKVSNKR